MRRQWTNGDSRPGFWSMAKGVTCVGDQVAISGVATGDSSLRYDSNQRSARRWQPKGHEAESESMLGWPFSLPHNSRGVPKPREIERLVHAFVDRISRADALLSQARC